MMSPLDQYTHENQFEVLWLATPGANNFVDDENGKSGRGS